MEPRKAAAGRVSSAPGGGGGERVTAVAQEGNLLTEEDTRRIRQELDYPSLSPVLKRIVDKNVVVGREAGESSSALRREVKKELSLRDVESRAQLEVEVQQLVNPFIPWLDPQEPNVQQVRSDVVISQDKAEGEEGSVAHLFRFVRPRFDRNWLLSLRDPELALAVAARWMFCQGTAHNGDEKVREVYQRFREIVSRKQGALVESRVEEFQHDDSCVRICLGDPPMERTQAVLVPGETNVSCALIFTECMKRVTLVDEEPRIQNPPGVELLPQAVVAEVDKFLDLRQLPLLNSTGCYQTYLSPGIANTTIATAPEWCRFKNATMVVQRLEHAPFLSVTSVELELLQMKEKLTRLIPLLRTYLSEYADLLGTFMMEKDVLCHDPVCDLIDQDFWPHRVMPAVSTLEAFWGPFHHSFHMNMALLTTFLHHASKAQLAMEEVQIRCLELCSDGEAELERRYRNLKVQLPKMRSVVEDLIDQLQQAEDEKATLQEFQDECEELIQQARQVQGKLAIVDPRLYLIFAGYVLTRVRESIPQFVRQQYPEDLPCFKGLQPTNREWYLWYETAYNNPSVLDYLRRAAGISLEAFKLTFWGEYDRAGSDLALQVKANIAAHACAYPWVAEATLSPAMEGGRKLLLPWYSYVYDRHHVGDIERAREEFVDTFDFNREPHWNKDTEVRSEMLRKQFNWRKKIL